MSKPKTYRHALELPEAVKTVYNAFHNVGEKVYLVGGCLRDAYYGHQAKDWDMATVCKPDQVKEILSYYRDRKHNYGIHHFPKGESFGVISAMPWCGNHETSAGRHAVEVEIATFRKDIGEGRRPDAVEFCEMEEDAKRRDLTINALYYDPGNGKIYDYVDGWEDLNYRRIRCVGNPMDRFREDPLRVLRYIRFFCKYADATSYEKGVDSDHQKAISVYSKLGLKGVSPERIREEFEKGNSSPVLNVPYINALKDADLLERTVFPGCEVNTNRIDQHCLETVIASILSETSSEKVEKILNSLTYSSYTCKHVAFYIRFAEQFKRPMMKADRAIPYKLKKYETSRNLDVNKFLRSWGDTMKLERRLVDVYRGWRLSPTASEVPGTASLKGKAIGERMCEYDTDQFWSLALQHGCEPL